MIFNPLGKEQLARIVKLLLKNVETIAGGAEDHFATYSRGDARCCSKRATIPPTARGRCGAPSSV